METGWLFEVTKASREVHTWNVLHHTTLKDSKPHIGAAELEPSLTALRDVSGGMQRRPLNLKDVVSRPALAS